MSNNNEEEIAVASTYVGLDSINTLLHIVGISLLVHLYRRGERKSQTMYLINLACVELVWSICMLPCDAMFLSSLLGVLVDVNVFWPSILFYTVNTGLTLNITFAMFLLTGDRLTQVIYGVRFNAYWTRTKTFVVIVITWVVNVTTSTVFGVLRYVHGYTKHLDGIFYIIVWYIVPSLNALYIIFAIIVYTTMLIKLVKSRRRFNTSNSSSSSLCSNICNIFFHSKFSTSILIITSYLMFTVTPNVTDSVWYNAYDAEPRRAHDIFGYFYSISIRFSCAIDALIYIFLHPKIKDLIRNLICGCKKESDSPIELPSAVRRVREKRQEQEMVELVEVRNEQNPDQLV